MVSIEVAQKGVNMVGMLAYLKVVDWDTLMVVEQGYEMAAAWGTRKVEQKVEMLVEAKELKTVGTQGNDLAAYLVL